VLLETLQFDRLDEFPIRLVERVDVFRLGFETALAKLIGDVRLRALP